MNFIATILMIGATGSASRSMETDDSIGRIVGQCIGGLVGDGTRIWQGNETSAKQKIEALVSGSQGFPQLTIDGQPREGLRAWGQAAWQVAGYVADRRSTGSVGYQYRLRVRGYDIRRETSISDGHVVLTTDAWWTESIPIGRQTKRIPIYVQIRIEAVERDGKTRLVGMADGTADTSDFSCWFVRRISERQAAEELDAGLRQSLATIQRTGMGLYASGDDIAGVLDAIDLGMKIGRLRR